MHCPRCGQQQISEETRFCSKCGFQLGLVSELLIHGGNLPQLAELYKKKTIFTRKNGLMLSLFWFIIFVPLLTSILGGALDIEFLGVACALIGVFGSFMIFVASLVYLDKAPNKVDVQMNELRAGNAQSLYGTANRATLPAQQSQSASSYVAPESSWKVPDTGEFARPGSVTDGTTRLLKKDE